MNAFLQRIIDDLRVFSGDLLEAGIRPALVSRTRTPLGSHSIFLETARQFCQLLPVLLIELESSEAPNRVLSHSVFTPAGAGLSKRPGDYQFENGRLLPWRWQREVPVLEPQTAALRWLLHLAKEHREAADALQVRLEKQVDEAWTARRGGSVWAEQDQHALQRVLDRIQEAVAQLEWAESILVQTGGGRLFASSSPPNPYPPSNGWSALRRHAAQWKSAQSSAAVAAAMLFGDRVEGADVPTLYQRWCGVMLLEAMQFHGWRLCSDPVGPLFLGGCIEFRKNDWSAGVWVEARLTQERAHPSGFYCLRGEATPDYLIIVPGRDGPDAFVLDAAKTANAVVLKEKERYLTLLMGATATRIAGVSAPRRPLCSWAAAPIVSPVCRLDGNDGRRGVVPLHPLHWTPIPLRHWFGEIDRHARAWAGA